MNGKKHTSTHWLWFAFHNRLSSLALLSSWLRRRRSSGFTCICFSAKYIRHSQRQLFKILQQKQMKCNEMAGCMKAHVVSNKPTLIPRKIVILVLICRSWASTLFTKSTLSPSLAVGAILTRFAPSSFPFSTTSPAGRFSTGYRGARKKLGIWKGPCIVHIVSSKYLLKAQQRWVRYQPCRSSNLMLVFCQW